MDKKSTFRQASLSQKRINKRSVFVIGGIFLGIVLAITVAATVIRSVNKEKEEIAAAEAAEKEYDTPPSTIVAPTQIRYADLTEGNTSYSTGTDYIVINQGNQNIRVNQDGSVDIVDANGKVIRSLTGSDKENAVETAVQIMEADVFADMALSGLESPHKAEQAAATTEKDTPETTAVTTQPVDYREKVSIILGQYGLTEDDLYRQIYTGGATPTTFWNMVEAGYLDPEEYIASIKVGLSQQESQTAELQQTGSQINADITAQTQQTGNTAETNTSNYPDWLTSDLNYADTLSAVLGSLGGSGSSSSDWENTNRQAEKQSWLDNQQNATKVTNQLTEWDLAPGTVINMTLITGLNTDMPGQVVGQIRANVYDSLTGTRILIPKGSKVVGTYSSGVAFGQKRVAIVWNQIITPDGFVFSGLGFNATDSQGFSGAQDQVFNHFWETLGGALLATLIDFGAEEAKGYSQDTLQGNIAMDAANAAATSLVNTSQTIGQKYVGQMTNRQPTIVIRPGAQLTMIVNSIVSFERKVTQ
jgi:type IV secretory pathway VirB10-like protein